MLRLLRRSENCTMVARGALLSCVEGGTTLKRLKHPPILTGHRLHLANPLEQALDEVEVENYFPMGCRGALLQLFSTP